MTPDPRILATDRLVLRNQTSDDAAFILELENEPCWLRYIGDKGRRTLEDVRNYIENGPVKMQQRYGFSLYLVELKESGTPIGICGLIQRETLPDVDIGFAFLSEYQGRGYALEAAAAVMSFGVRTLDLPRIVALVSPENVASIRLLEKLGFRFERVTRLTDNAPELNLYAANGDRWRER